MEGDYRRVISFSKGTKVFALDFEPYSTHDDYVVMESGSLEDPKDPRYNFARIRLQPADPEVAGLWGADVTDLLAIVKDVLEYRQKEERCNEALDHVLDALLALTGRGCNVRT